MHFIRFAHKSKNFYTVIANQEPNQDIANIREGLQNKKNWHDFDDPF